MFSIIFNIQCHISTCSSKDMRYTLISIKYIYYKISPQIFNKVECALNNNDNIRNHILFAIWSPNNEWFYFLHLTGLWFYSLILLNFVEPTCQILFTYNYVEITFLLFYWLWSLFIGLRSLRVTLGMWLHTGSKTMKSPCVSFVARLSPS